MVFDDVPLDMQHKNIQEEKKESVAKKKIKT
jgi:hypothetical protein